MGAALVHRLTNMTELKTCAYQALIIEELKVFDNPALLLWSLVFGLFGLGFFTYGKRQAAPIPLAVGLTLMIYPYFVTNLALLIAIGIALIALPYFVKI
ncbi:hypothetical protein [Shewanella sp. GD04112]|uniref:hypothetical protein n=1 Tax=Shewanella sp. GD04112 TaxID=2975434 RepID=UPI00244A53A8|nr:hypothetical protein [Shewanella sp. GD04112]MDH0448942.1 hypothetical protein [Shewanella sp. GD04112]